MSRKSVGGKWVGAPPAAPWPLTSSQVQRRGPQHCMQRCGDSRDAFATSAGQRRLGVMVGLSATPGTPAFRSLEGIAKKGQIMLKFAARIIFC